MKVNGIHHVAYRCKDAKETVAWYGKYLDMGFVLAIAENEVPSTKEPDPYMHVFLDAGGGNILAFFELPTQPEMGRDPNTPAWVQHLALKAESMESMLATKARLEADGLDEVKWDMLEEWSETKRAPQHARWMHDGSYSGGSSDG